MGCECIKCSRRNGVVNVASQKLCCFLQTFKSSRLTPVPLLRPSLDTHPAQWWLSWRGIPVQPSLCHRSCLCPRCCQRGEELKLFLSLQLPSKASSHSLRVGNWSERKSHRLPRLPKRHSHDDMLLLAQLGIPSSPSSLNEDSLSTASELLSTRRARRIPKVLGSQQPWAEQSSPVCEKGH